MTNELNPCRDAFEAWARTQKLSGRVSDMSDDWISKLIAESESLGLYNDSITGKLLREQIKVRKLREAVIKLANIDDHHTKHEIAVQALKETE